MRSHLILVSSLMLLGSGFSLAEEAATPAGSSDTSRVQWRGYLGVGSSLAPKSEAIVKYQGTSLTSDTTKDKASIGGSGELEAVFHPVFSGSLLVDYAPYKYKDGSKSDSSLSLMVMPKARAQFGLWAGLGLGLNRTSIGETNYTEDTTSITYDESTLSAFVISPRVGYDFVIQPGVTLGAFAAYYSTSTSTTVSVVDATVPLDDKLTLDFSRSWWNLVVRVGFDL